VPSVQIVATTWTVVQARAAEKLARPLTVEGEMKSKWNSGGIRRVKRRASKLVGQGRRRREEISEAPVTPAMNGIPTGSN
jgi:hypothetical protein